MPTFAVEVQNSKIVQDFYKKVDEKMHQSYFVTAGHKIPNILTGKVLRLDSYPNDTYVIDANYSIPCLTPYIAMILAIPIAVFWQTNFTWLWIIPIVFLLLSFFWTKRFISIVQSHSLRKLGFKDKIKIIRNDETIKRLMNRVTI